MKAFMHCAGTLALLTFVGASYASNTVEALKTSLAPLDDADGKSVGLGLANSLTLEAGTSDTKATVSFVDYLGTESGVHFGRVQVRGEAPVSSKGSSDSIDVGTLSGLTAGSTAHLEVSWIRWPALPEAVVKADKAICDEEFPAILPGYDFATALDMANIGTPCVASVFTQDSLKTILQRLLAKRLQCKDVKQPLIGSDIYVCGKLLQLNDPHLVQEATTDLKLTAIRARFRPIQQQAPSLGIFTLGSTVNRQKVNYFLKNDLTTLVKDQTTGYGINAVYSYLRNDVFLSAGISYERSYKSADNVQVCAPVASSTALECPQGGIGAPAKKIARIAFAESRFFVLAGKLAMSPRVEYDQASSKLAVRLPIYLTPDKNKALIGGIAFGYTTHGDGFGASVFIGKAFSFF